MQFTTIFAAIMATLPTALAAPALTNQLVERDSGFATYYNTAGIASSCGEYPTDNDYVAALAFGYMPGSCGKSVRVTATNTGVSVVVKIVESCAACGTNGVVIDVTPAVFEKLNNGDLDAGRIPVTWDFTN